MTEFEQVCRDYLDDKLLPEERMRFEQRLSSGDKELIETLQRLRSFKAEMKDEQIHSQPDMDSMADSVTDLIESIKQSENKSDNDDENLDSVNKKNRLRDSIIWETYHEKQENKYHRVVTVSLGLIVLITVLTALYLQWENYITEQKLIVTEKKLEQSDSRINLLKEQLRLYKFDSDRIKDVLTSDFTTLSIMEINTNVLGKWIQLWDKGTLRIAVMVTRPNLKDRQQIQLWSRNVKTKEWLKVGSLINPKENTIYTEWDTQNLARSSGLELRLIDIKSNSSETIHRIRF